MDNNQVNNNQVNTPVEPQANNQVNNQVNTAPPVSNQVQKDNERQGRGLFYGIIAIAVFIIMAVGATYAYFTARTNSMDNSVRTGSTTIELDYLSYEGAWMHDDLIPVATNIAEYSFERQDDTTISNQTTNANALCKDDSGNSICSVYVFQVRNTAASNQTVSIDLESIQNTFANLRAMIYEVSADTSNASYTTSTNDPIFKTNNEDTTENSIGVIRGTSGTIVPNTEYTPVYINRTGVTKTLLQVEDTGATVNSINRIVPDTSGDRKVKLASGVVIGGEGQNQVANTKTFAIVLYIYEINDDQTVDDSAKIFSGRVNVEPEGGNGGGVTGQIGIATSETLQSGETIGSGTTTDTSGTTTEP